MDAAPDACNIPASRSVTAGDRRNAFSATGRLTGRSAMSDLIYAARAVGRQLRCLPWEAMIWIIGLAAMASFDPRADTLETWCLFNRIFGLDTCPGCGLGHSIAFLARGEWAASVRAHPLGIPAVITILLHVGRLLMVDRPRAAA